MISNYFLIKTHHTDTNDILLHLSLIQVKLL